MRNDFGSALVGPFHMAERMNALEVVRFSMRRVANQDGRGFDGHLARAAETIGGRDHEDKHRDCSHGGASGAPLGDDPMVARVHAHAVDIVAEAACCVGPDIGRRRFVEQSLVAGFRLLVQVMKLGLFVRAAFRWSVVDRRAEHPTAEIVPVRTRVNQVQVPGLIDLLRRRDGVPRRHGQEHEFLVLLDDSPGIIRMSQPLSRARRWVKVKALSPSSGE